MLNKTEAKRTEVVTTKTRKYKIFIFECLDCQSEIRVWPGHLSEAKQKCRICANKSRPFQHCHTYMKLSAKHKGRNFSLTYEDYVSFTKLDCHYCEEKIPWEEWSKGSGYNKAYYIDRMDNTKGYDKDNCVACCTECNFTRGNRYSYKEFLLFGPILKFIKQNRKDGTEYN